MQKETNVKILKKYAAQLQKGYPLILKDALANPGLLKNEGEILNLLDEQGRFLGKGYYGKQNKGYGWIISKKENEGIDQQFFTRKLKAAADERKPFYESADTASFRMFNGEGDGIGGLTIDYYDGFYLISWYSLGIYTFKKQIIQALKETVSFKGIYQKKRFDFKGQYIEEDDFVEGERGEFPLIVKENGANFAVYLNDGAMVGVFLDQREVRKTIRDRYSKGKTVLNMFSYTGAFAVFAALGGAVKTTSVDVANRSKSKTIEQFSVNGIDFEAQDIIVEDVFHYFKYAAKKKMKFDLVILDPPSFAKTKKHTFSAVKDYKELLKESIEITEKNGVIVASTNSSALSMDKFKKFIDAAFKEIGCKYKLEEEFSLPGDFKTSPDFKEGSYLKVVFVRVIS